MFIAEGNDVPTVDILKIRRHLGHASSSVPWGAFSREGESVSEESIEAALCRCPCGKSRFGLERPIVHANGPIKCAAHVGLDIYYPVPNAGMTRPFLLMVCMLSRFVLTEKLSNHRPENAVGAFFKTWIQSIGKSTRVMSDKGTPFTGDPWGELTEVFDIEHCASCTHSPHENGLTEREISLAKEGSKVIRSICKGLSDERTAQRACVSKNLTPMIGSGISPAQAMHGRSSMCDSLENRQLIDPKQYDTLSDTLQVQLEAALQARTVLAQRDEQRTIELGLSLPLRAHATTDFKMGDGAVIFIRNQTLRGENGPRILE